MFEFLRMVIAGSSFSGVAAQGNNLLARIIMQDHGMGRFYLVIIAAIAAAYFLGNISPATLIGRAMGVDIKKEGSGNAGTTNVARVLGVKAAAGTLLIDVCKGMAAVLLGRALGGDFLAMIVVLPVILGHIWPVVLRFQGGKGVATAFGALVILDPAIGFGELAVVVLGVLISRRMSVGSFAGCAGLPVLSWFLLPPFFPDGLCIGLIVLFKHRTNIMRVARGKEPPISFGHRKQGTAEERKHQTGQSGDQER